MEQAKHKLCIFFCWLMKIISYYQRLICLFYIYFFYPNHQKTFHCDIGLHLKCFIYAHFFSHIFQHNKLDVCGIQPFHFFQNWHNFLISERSETGFVKKKQNNKIGIQYKTLILECLNALSLYQCSWQQVWGFNNSTLIWACHWVYMHILVGLWS